MTRQIGLLMLMGLAGCVGGGGDSSDGGGASGDGGGGSSGSGGAGSGGDAGDGCVTERVTTQNVDKVDILFVVDNSESMADEQAALRAQMPRLITTLTTGVRPDGGPTFSAVRSLNLGVISTDMGLPGVPNREGLGCGTEARPQGDDGVLQNAPNPGGVQDLSCLPGYPPFLTFTLTADAATNSANAAAIANNFACVASLGTSGCGFEMPLEAALRAVWPSDNVLPNGQPGTFADGRPFLDGSSFGKGAPVGPNAGFLRNNVNEGLSVIAVVVVTDEDDCSSHNMGHFVPNEFLIEGDPLRNVAMNLRCFNESARAGGDEARDNGEGNLYAVSRYAQGLKALRPGNEQQVIFAAITGLPTDLVDRAANVDFTNSVQRDLYYDSLLADLRLVEVADPNTSGTELIPSCLRTTQDSEGNDVVQKAFPPRRLIKMAQAFGEGATVQSICADDFTPAINRIIDAIARRLGSVCFPDSLTADADGLVPCHMLWELPLPGTAPANTPTACVQRSELLSSPPANAPQVSAEGRPLCLVNQVPVVPCSGGPVCEHGSQPNQTPGADSNGDPISIHGWYYDFFSADIANCPGRNKQRIAFTTNPGVDAHPPSGVTVRLVCPEDGVSSCF